MSFALNKAISAPTKIQALILLTLLMLMPFAMSFTAAENTYANIPSSPDSLYILRAILILVGLMAAVLSFAILLIEFLKSHDEYVVWHMSMTLCSFTIGWLFFPFWVNGVFQAYQGNGPGCTLNLYDPQDLIPATWVGIIWHLPALLTYPIAMFGGIILFILALILLRYREWKHGIPTLICLAIFAALIWGFPECATWIID